MTIPQIGAMYAGDRSRKENLVENGFRLPSAMDNRPLKFDEFESKMRQVVAVSATPGKYEVQKSTESSLCPLDISLFEGDQIKKSSPSSRGIPAKQEGEHK